MAQSYYGPSSSISSTSPQIPVVQSANRRALANSRANSYARRLNRWNSGRDSISRPEPDLAGKIPVTLPSEMDELLTSVLNGINTDDKTLITPPKNPAPEVPKQPGIRIVPWGNLTAKASQNSELTQPQRPPTGNSKSESAEPFGGSSSSDASKTNIPSVGRYDSNKYDNPVPNDDTTTRKPNASSMGYSNSIKTNNPAPALPRSSSSSRNRGAPNIFTKSIPKYGTAKIEIYTRGIDEEKLHQLFEATKAFLDIVAQQPEFKTCVLTDFI